jgi:imidazolonepropionase-like amidohydrolase
VHSYRSFAAAGGLLLAGSDPTDSGDARIGFDQREIELLGPGFSPADAIKNRHSEWAVYLDQDKHIGSIAVGKNADLAAIKRCPI